MSAIGALKTISGGAWIVGDKFTGAHPCLIHAAASAGWLVLSINYRMPPAYNLNQMVMDVKRAIYFARYDKTFHAKCHAATELKDQRVVVMGESSGGHLAAVAGLLRDRAPFTLEKGSVASKQGERKLYTKTGEIGGIVKRPEEVGALLCLL